MVDQGSLAEVVAKLAGASAANVSDVLGKGLSRKLKHQTMDAQIKPVCDSLAVCGPAFTVRCYPGATYAMEKAIVEAPAGSVIVCDGQGSDAGVMMGGLMSTVAKMRGVVGAVIDGATRDVADIIELGFAMFARHVVARSGTFDQLGDLQETITCGGVVVRPGDIVVGDRDGVVVVPQEIAVQVAVGAEGLARWEHELQREILSGKSLEEAAAKLEKPPIQQI